MLIDHTLARCHIKNNFQRREVVLAFSDSTTISFISMSKTIYLIKILWTIGMLHVILNFIGKRKESSSPSKEESVLILS